MKKMITLSMMMLAFATTMFATTNTKAAPKSVATVTLHTPHHSSYYGKLQPGCHCHECQVIRERERIERAHRSHHHYNPHCSLCEKEMRMKNHNTHHGNSNHSNAYGNTHRSNTHSPVVSGRR